MFNWRKLIVGLAMTACVISVSTFIVLCTLQATILNRDTVKQWLRQSNTYQTLATTVVQDAGGQAGSAAIPTQALQTAIGQTFTADYLQNQTESILDHTYDWLEGKGTVPNLLLPTDQKRPELADNLSAQLSEQWAQLPACQSAADFNAQTPTCIPAGIDIGQAASQLASQVAGTSTVPTNQPRVQGDAVTAAPAPASWLAAVRQLTFWLWVTPLIAVTSIILTTAIGRPRLATLRRLLFKLVLSSLLMAIIGKLTVSYGPRLQFNSNYAEGAFSAGQIVGPLLHVALPDIGQRLFTFSIVATGAALISMFAVIVLQRLGRSSQTGIRTNKLGSTLPPTR